MDWSQRKVTHAARKPPNITHSVRIAVDTGGGKGQGYSKRKKGRKNERKKEKETKTTQNNKRGEKKGWENCKKRFRTQSTKYLKKPKLKLKIWVNLKMIKVPRNI